MQKCRPGCYHAAVPADERALTDALAAYLSHRTPRDPLEDAPPPWRFTPMPGTRVSVQTGPGARAHLSDLAGRGITDEGLDPDGFLRLRLPL